MRLKSIELTGFKSFPDKTRVIFEKPVTVIVGPNGSGKSNIADAMLWVTGEQSAKAMRGGRMEDVIFGGTKRRAPTGYAEVSLTLENEDGGIGLENTEIVITRKYYRSGESEYFINRKTSRLKDITELLMDTGLGREGYSVIGQGKIAEILAARSRDRRDIFEEAVGISRFRHRKEEAERRLEQTDENLTRINDKISELSLQLEPLRKQAETARRYLLLRDETRELEIALWARRLVELREQIVKAEIDIDAVAAQQRTAAAESERVYRDIENADEQRRKYDTEQDALRIKASEIGNRAAEIAQTRTMQQTRLENNIARIENIRQDVERRAERESGLEAQIKERENRALELEDEAAVIETSLKNIESKLEEILKYAAEEEREYAALFDAQREQEYLLAENRARLGGLGVTAQELSDRETDETAEMIRITDEIAAAEKNVQLKKTELESQKAECGEQRNKLRGFEIRMQSRKEELSSAEDKSRRISREIETASIRAKTLEQMEREHEGYARPVRAVMSEKSRGTLSGIHGAVGDLMRTSEKYALAVETALGAAVGNIIVENDNDGKAAINMLKRRDAGRATFLPLSVIRGNILNINGLNRETGFEGIAFDLISCDEKYNEIFKNLLGRTIIINNLDEAVTVSRKYSARFRIVTLDGQIINAGGAMTGGSSSHGAGILSRAGELLRLRKNIAELNEQFKNAEQLRAEAGREAASAEFEYETARADLRDFEDVEMRRTNDYEASLRLLSEYQKTGENLRILCETLHSKTEKIALEIDELRMRISEQEAAVEQAKVKLAVRGESRLEKNTEREHLQNNAHILREKLAANAAERETTLGAIEQLRDIRMGIITASEEQLGSAEALETQNNALRSEIAALENDEKTLRDEANALKSRESEINEEKLSLEAKRTALDRLSREKSKEAVDLEREKSRLEQRRTTFETEETALVSRMWDTYEITRAEAIAKQNEIQDEQTARRRVAELRREMSELGSPNIGAIEEFERVNERYIFLSEQRDDVEKAAVELRELISEITVQMREIFVSGFADIETSFKTVFTELFGGGEATLTLEEPDDPLISGIEIKVQPPGKQLRTLTLLSGGERAFVAIALYFAILNVKPAPFVVLDEIEAALDDSNVLRFAQYLRRMSENTQMIVISHRRGTMEEADVLIGVTMAERGVSRMITLTLDEAEKTIGVV